MAGQASLLLLGTFGVLAALGIPLAVSIVVAALAAVLMMVPLDMALFTAAQKMMASLDSFSLLAVPFFILSGVMMNSGGIAIRLVNFAKLISGRIPGALAQTNIAGNMLFGCISGSAIAASTSIGGVMVPMQEKEGYDKRFAAAINIVSAPTGMLIPPTTAFIIYSLVSGGTSIAALFLGGAVAGALWGIGLMAVTAVMAWRRGYRSSGSVSLGQAGRITLDALPSLFLIVLVIGGITFGIFTAVEASGIAVLYTLLLALVIHRTVPLRAVPGFLLETAQITGTIMLLLAASAALSFAMAFTGIPAAISSLILGLSNNPEVVMLIINAILLVVGCFMDIGPAILIFTPILLPIAQKVGYDPVHFGIIMVFNLAIGTITPPVGTGLFVGASVAKERVERIIPVLWPFYLLLFALLLVVTYWPALTLSLPRLLNL
ncbi:TRAP transporter large permease [Pseudooceanicola sp. CBS1P-1]|uniref:TRAP transporter large permease protein n=1 Tax=Pseudooceanicola albus TaxID=2692189 RepID=A0A6L7G801_9RHOB|nr:MULTISPECIES: TRAP transporter large permease [Pseudooceanicola]MBT9385911.1 TRAP transporter large permease [Pseudooceanicola endophyticus]MXN19668.1 TRAP transporter large permease subunit [Pseudooceanicola albus]